MKFDLYEFLKENQISFVNEDLSKKSYIKIGFFAPTVYPNDEEELISLVSRFEGCVEYKLLGAMSNILLLGGERVFIKTDHLSGVSFENNRVHAACGARFSRLIKAAEQRRLSLLPRLFGIPGSVGGMVYSNAGAFDSQISDSIISSRVFDVGEKRILELSRDEMKFGYRKSILTEKKFILLSAVFSAAAADVRDIDAEISDVIEKRRRTQPYGPPSLGSVFKRPENDYAARLIDAAGLRGFRVGGAEISEKHAGFIVNRDSATARDVVELIELARSRVLQKFGIRLEEEIEILR